MVREVDQDKLLPYTGKFSANPSTLKRNDKAADPDYDPHDPKTWPVMTFEQVDAYYADYFGKFVLPPYVAYEWEIINTYVALHPDKNIEVDCVKGTTIWRSMYFHHFPFVYNHNGKARNFTYTHADHYTSWVYGVTGKKPQTRARGKESPPSQTDTFSEILDLIRETQPESPTDEIASSKDVNENLQIMLQEKKNKHVATQAQLINAQNASRNLKSQLDTSTSMTLQRETALCKEKLVLISAKSELTALTQELETVKKASKEAKKAQDEELEAVKKEAATTMNTIRDELNKAKDAGARKRQASGDASRVPDKKIKKEE